MVPWIILIAVFVLVKDNRNPRALLVLAPLLTVNLLWLGSTKLPPLNLARTSDKQMFNTLFESVAVGITVLWLLGHKLGNRNHFVTFTLALAVMIMLGTVGAISYWGLELSKDSAAWLITFGVFALTHLISLALSGCCCRKRYGSVRFMLWLALWTVSVCVVTAPLVAAVAFAIKRPPVSLSTFQSQVCVMALIFGLCLYVVNFPYMILAFRSSFFRERFYACLRLKSMPATDEPKTGTDHLGDPVPDTCQNGDSD